MSRKTNKMTNDEWWKGAIDRNTVEWNKPERVKERERKKRMRDCGGKMGDCQIIDSGVTFPWFVCSGDPFLGPIMDCPRFCGGRIFWKGGIMFLGCIGEAPCNWGPEAWPDFIKNLKAIDHMERDDRAFGSFQYHRTIKAKLVDIMLGMDDWPKLIRAKEDVPIFADLDGDVTLKKGDVRWLSMSAAKVLISKGAAEPTEMEAEDGQERT